MDSLIRDIRFGINLLWKDRGFTLTAVLTLAVCIGANTSIFAVVNSVLLRPLPVPDADRILIMSNQYPKAGFELMDAGVADYDDRLREVTALGEQAIFRYNDQTFEIGGSAERIRGFSATPSLFRLLEVQPMLGRIFTKEEGEVGHQQKVILSYALWQQMFGGSGNVLGQQMRFGPVPYEIVGVMPRNFQFFSADVRFWVPAAFTPAQRADNTRLSSGWFNVGRLKPGATMQQAKAQVDALDKANLDRFPQFRDIFVNAGQYTRVERLQDMLVRRVRGTLYLLWGGAAFVLLIGAVNIANLALARSNLRLKEIATRLALGAGRVQVARQLVTESVIVAVVGGLAGLLLGSWILDGLRAIGLDQLPRAGEIQMDARVVFFIVGVSVMAGIIIGLVPVSQLLSIDINGVLHEEGRTGTSGRGARAFRRGLVVAQIGFAFVLLIGAGLLFTSFQALLHVDPGFNPDGVLATTINIPRGQQTKVEDIVAFMNRTLDAIKAVPGVRSAGATSSVPFDGIDTHSLILADGYEMKPGESVISPRRMIVTPGYFSVMSIPLLSGRYFEDQDTSESPRVVLVDERLAQRFWPGRDPVGRQLFVPNHSENVTLIDKDTRHFTVVGLVREVRQDDLAGNRNFGGTYYFPYTQQTPTQMTLAIKTSLDEESAVRQIRAVIKNLNPDVPVFNVHTMTELTDVSLMPRKASMVLALSFGAVALLLSVVGIYGVLAYVVNQRSREIGIRIALGSTSRNIFGLVLREGLVLVGIGLVLGLAGAVALRHVIENQIYGVQPLDPFVIGVAFAILGLCALVACVLPARRATLVDPVVVLSA